MRVMRYITHELPRQTWLDFLQFILYTWLITAQDKEIVKKTFSRMLKILLK